MAWGGGCCVGVRSQGRIRCRRGRARSAGQSAPAEHKGLQGWQGETSQSTLATVSVVAPLPTAGCKPAGVRSALSGMPGALPVIAGRPQCNAQRPQCNARRPQCNGRAKDLSAARNASHKKTRTLQRWCAHTRASASAHVQRQAWAHSGPLHDAWAFASSTMRAGDPGVPAIRCCVA